MAIASCERQYGDVATRAFCQGLPASIEVVSIDVVLKRVASYGHVATGAVRLGTSFAQ